MLKAGEKRQVTFSLSKNDLAILNDQGKPVPFTGNVTISVGGCQPGEQTALSKKVQQATLKM